MSFIRLTKNKEIDEILKKIGRLIATLNPMYDYTEEGEDVSVFNQLKNVMYEMVNDEVKKNKKNIPELKKTLLYYLNEDFKDSITEEIAKGRTLYNKKLEPTSDNIEDIIEDLRDLYSRELSSREFFYANKISEQAQDFYRYTEKERKKLKMPKEFIPIEFDEMTDPILVELRNKFDRYIKLYEELKGKRYRKGIKINKEKEEAEKSIRKDKEEARRIRDELIAKQREERRIRDEISALQKAEREAKKPKKSRKQLEQEKYGVSGTIPENVSILDNIDQKLTSYSIPEKVKKGLFSDIKDLVSSIVEEEKIELPEPELTEEDLLNQVSMLLQRLDPALDYYNKNSKKSVFMKIKTKIQKQLELWRKNNVLVSELIKNIPLYEKVINQALKRSSKAVEEIDVVEQLKNLVSNLDKKLEKVNDSDLTKKEKTKINKELTDKALEKSKNILAKKPVQPPIQVIPKSSTFKLKSPKSRMDKIAETLKGLQPHYPEREGNRDRTGKLLTQEEVDRLIRVRERLAQKKIPKNEVVEEEKGQELEYGEPVQEPVVKRRGRPPNPESKRQQKLKEPKKVEEVKPEPKKRGPKPNPESKRQQKLKKSEEAPPTSEPKKRGRPKKAPEEKSRPPPKKEGVGRPKKCDEVKPKLDNIQPYDLREDKRIITKADIFSIPFETKKGTRYEVNHKLFMNINATPFRFLNVVDKILNKFNLKIDNERTKPTRKSFLEELESLSSSGRKRALIYRKISQYLIAKGVTTAYDLEHNLTQEILKDLNEKEDSSKLVAFEKYVEKNCIDKPKSETQQEVKPKEKQPKQPKQPKQAQKDPDVTFNYMLENIDKYSNEFKKAEQPTPKTILKIVSDIWSKPANNTLRFKDGNIEAFITETDETDNVLGNVYDQRPIKSVVSAIITAITEKYDIPDLYAYVKNKENKSKLSDDIIEKLTELLDKIGGRLLKKNEPTPRRYK